MKSDLIVLCLLAGCWGGCRGPAPEGDAAESSAPESSDGQRRERVLAALEPGASAAGDAVPRAALQTLSETAPETAPAATHPDAGPPPGAGGAGGAAEEASVEEFLERLEACETEACRREHVIARAGGSPPPPPPARDERDFASRLKACETSRCVFDLLPIEQRAPIGFDGCRPLDGRVSIAGADDGVELGLFCRLRIARARAAHRKQAPCTDLGGPNPDYTVNHQGLRLLVFNELVRGKHVKRRGWVSSQQALGNNSTLHDSYVFDKGVVDRAGGSRALARAYFCMSGEPGRYYPYFFALLQAAPEGGGSGGAFSPQRTLAAEYIGTLPARPHVVYQLGNVEPGEASLYELADVNGDSVEDLVLLDERWEGATRHYGVRVCLYAPREEACRLLAAPVRLGRRDAGLGVELDTASPVLAVERRRVTVGFRRSDEPATVLARFRVKNRELLQVD